MPQFPGLRALEFAAGPKDGETLNIELPPITVLVGPNNSGKSRTLHEIEDWCRGNDLQGPLIKSVSPHLPSNDAEAERALERFLFEPDQQQPRQHNQVNLQEFDNDPHGGFHTYSIDRGMMTNAVSGGHVEYMRQYLLGFHCLRLDGRSRFSLASPRPVTDILESPKNTLWQLFQDDAARGTISEYLQTAFGKYFVVDPTLQGQLRARLSARRPSRPEEEQALAAEARTFHSAAQLLTEASDGVQAFTGILMALFGGPHRILLLDEPEASSIRP